MPLALISGPAIEPLALSEAKSFLRVDENDEDSLIQSLIVAARVHIEQLINQKLITQSWSVFLSLWPESNQLQLAIGPVQAVTEIKIYDAEGVSTVWNSDHYTIDTLSQPARIIRKSDWAVSGALINGIEISVTVGYGENETDIPEPIRQAMRYLVTHWYENREPVSLGDNSIQIPDTVQSLLMPYMAVRI